MRRCWLSIAGGLLIALFTTTIPATAQDEVTGADVKRAVRLGVHALKHLQRGDGTWPGRAYAGGTTCLATLALLQAGVGPDDPAVAAAILNIRDQFHEHVYVVSLKVLVLARADAEQHADEIEDAADWLIKAQNDTGLWDYRSYNPEVPIHQPRTNKRHRFDHSNTQFALLGLHAAAEAGVEIPPIVWQRAQRALLRHQNRDGGWAYQATGPSYGSMTAAGVANLVILGAQLFVAPKELPERWPPPNCGRYQLHRPLASALRWLSENYTALRNPRSDAYHYYWLYAVERAGILSGQRFFGEHDWYREGARVLVRQQDASGLWNRQLIDTCFAVLFLAKGHKSLLVQKLQWSAGSEWAPTRHELDHLVAFIGDTLGDPVTWQTIELDATLEEWLAAPILYLSGYEFPELTRPQREKLRTYVERGGTLLADACCGREAFAQGFEKFARATFPELPLRELGDDHALYRVVHEVPAYGLKGIDYGCRTSVIFSPRDLSCLWETATVPQLSEQAFKLGTNIAAYAVGRRPLRDRLDVVVLPAEKQAEAQTGQPPLDAFRLAQVVYTGDWQPFPGALPNLARFLREHLGFDIVVQPQQIRLTDEGLKHAPILFLAGHHDFTFSKAERDALAAHLKRGGFLIADACCGTEPFGSALRRMLAQALPGSSLERLPDDHPIFTGRPGVDVTSVSYSEDVARKQPNLKRPVLWGLRVDGRLAVVYSPYSLSCGLNGPVFDGCWGLVSEDARRLASNIILYALSN